VFIQGGGFTVNGNANYNATDLINAADNQMVVVNFNYRVGPYGFLASKEIVDDKSLGLNNGLKDQRQLLKWVQTYIHNFGGDPDHITLGGASAGAGSVVLQLTAYGGRNDNLFHAVAAESPAFPPMRNVTASQFAYDALLKQTGCADLKCMRDMDTVTFQKAVRALKLKFPRAAGPPIYFWGPTLDYDFIRDYTFREIKAGHFVKVPTIFGDSSNEGMTFTPNTVTNQQRAEQFLANQWPTIGPNQVQISEAWHGPVDMMFDSKWRSMAADVYGHIRYICPTLNISAAYADNGSHPIWQYRWNVGPAQHVGELLNIWHNGTSAAGVFMQSYFTSFIRSYDPNKHMTSYWPEGAAEMTSPRWEPFTKGEDGSGQGGRRMLFQDMNYVAMENVGSVERERCQVISNMGLQLEQYVEFLSSLLYRFFWKNGEDVLTHSLLTFLRAASPATRIRPLLFSFGFGHLAYIVPLLSLLQYFVT
jgi:carboxylesterase type B